MTGFRLAQIRKEYAEEIRIYTHLRDGREVSFDYEFVRGNDSSQPIQIIVDFARPIHEEAVLIRVEWRLENGEYKQVDHLRLEGGQKRDKNDLALERMPVVPELSFMHSELRVKFEGDRKLLVENLKISIRDIMGVSLDFGFNPNNVKRFRAGEVQGFPIDLSRTGSMHNVVDLSWSVNGEEFDMSIQMILR